MAVKAAELEAELIDAVCVRVRKRLPDEQAATASATPSTTSAAVLRLRRCRLPVELSAKRSVERLAAN